MSRSRFLRVILTLLAALLLAAPGLLSPRELARADVGELPEPGGLITPGDKTDQIRMKSEKVVFSVRPNDGTFTQPEAQYYAHVTADFVMQNLSSKAASMDLFFPLHLSYLPAYQDPVYAIMKQAENVKVVVDGREVQVSYAELALSSSENVVAAVFPVDFPAGSETVIEVEYDVRAVNEGKSSSLSFKYMMQTGSHWAGTIGSGKVIFQFWQPVDSKSAFIYVNDFFQTKDGRLEWDFTDLEPTSEHDITLTFEPAALQSRAGPPINVPDVRGSAPAWNVSYVGQFGGWAYAAAVRGNRAYLGVGPRLLVLDVSRRSQPVLLGQTLPLPGLVRGLAVGLGRVYVANDAAGLTVVNVADPAHPFQMGALDTPGQALGVVAGQRRAYVADGDAGLRVIDINRPARPMELGFYDTPGQAYGLAVRGRYAYVADGAAGLRVIDVADPRHPAEVGFYDTPGEAWGVAVAGRYAYVADRDGGLRIVDLSDPAHPAEAGFYDTPDMAAGVAVARGYAYVANGAAAAGLLVVDVRDPAHPQPVGSTTQPAAGVVVAGRYAYAVDWEHGLRVVDIANPRQPRQVGIFDTTGGATGVTAAEGYAYLSAWGAGLHVVDVSDPARLAEAGFLEGEGWYKRTAVSDGYAYGACGWGGLRVVDIADPAHPAEVGVYVTPGHAEDVAVWSTDAPPGLYAAVANTLEGVRVVDVADPAHPVEVGFCDTPGQAFGVAVEGGYAYVADDTSGLRVLSVGDPAHPVEVGSYDTPMNAFGVAVMGGYAYVADGGSGLRVIDISDPAQPTEVGSCGTPGPATSVAVRGDYAYVAAGDGGLRVVDISDPTLPREVGYYDTLGWAQEVALAETPFPDSGQAYVYLADESGGLWILSFNDQTLCTFGGPYQSDEHTLLLLHLDGSYDGVQGEAGSATGTSFLPGRFGQGVLVDGTDLLTYTAAGNWSLSQGSLEFWVRPNWDGADEQYHLLFEESRPGYADNLIRLEAGGWLTFRLWDSTSGHEVVHRTDDWKAGDWHHVAVIWQDPKLALYEDGQLVDSNDQGGVPDWLGAVLSIGSGLSWSEYRAQAVIDELRISDVPRLGNSDVCGRSW